MILTAGWFKGMKLEAPKGDTTRPTSSKARESLLNTLAQELEGSVFVDLFAGTGSVGLSAVSRGAKGCIFVENDQMALKSLNKNVAEGKRRAEKQGLTISPFIVLPCSAQSSFNRIKAQCTPNIVWADPPYQQTVSWFQETRTALASLVPSGGYFALESATSDLSQLALEASLWEQIRQKSFHESTLTLWQRREESKS
jgi:16S rRNA (guanine(966)-N(2))-methyltransferase RsmD